MVMDEPIAGEKWPSGRFGRDRLLIYSAGPDL